MHWNNRTLVDSHGMCVTTVTDQTPSAVFERYKALVNQHLVELEFCMNRFAEQRASGVTLTRAPDWSVKKERLLNRLAKEAGLRDS